MINWNWVGWKARAKAGTLFLLLLIFAFHPTPSFSQTASTPIFKFCYYDDPLNSLPSSCEFSSNVRSANYDCSPVFDGYQCFDNRTTAICGMKGKTLNDLVSSKNGNCNNPSSCIEGGLHYYLTNKTAIFPENHYELYCKRDEKTGEGKLTKCNIGTNGNVNDPNNACVPLIQVTSPFRGERPDCSNTNFVDASSLYGIRSGNSRMNPKAAESLNRVKQEVIQKTNQATGDSVFGSLAEILRPANWPASKPGVAYKSWHKTGRAIDLNIGFRNSVFRVEPEGRMFRVFLRDSNLDLTEILERNGWFRIPAVEGVEEWWHYQYHPDNISWENAIYQVYSSNVGVIESAFPDVDWGSVSQNCTTGNYSYGSSNTKPCSLTGNFYEDVKPKTPKKEGEKVTEEDFTCENPITCIEQNIFSKENGRKPRGIFCVDDDSGKGQKYLCPETSKGDPKAGFRLTYLNSYTNLFSSASNRNGDLPPASRYLSGIPGKYQNTNLRYCVRLYELMKSADVSRTVQKPSLGYLGILTRVSQVIFSASAFLFILLIILNGIKFVRSAGDPTELKKASQGLFNAIAGFLFIVFAGGFIISLIRLLQGS